MFGTQLQLHNSFQRKMFKITLNSPIKCNITATTIIQREEGQISANEIVFSIPTPKHDTIYPLKIFMFKDMDKTFD